MRKYGQTGQAYALHFSFSHESQCGPPFQRRQKEEKELGCHNKLEVEQESH